MAKKAKKKKTITNNKDMFVKVAMFFALWTMIVIPLWLENQYFNQTAAKGHAFLLGAAITVLLILCVAVAQNSIKPVIPHKNVTESSIVVFAVLAVISSLLSELKIESFLGYKGWWVGGLQMLLFAILVIFLSRELEWTRLLEGAIMITGIIVYFIELLHGAGVDFLFLHRHMMPDQYWSYLSTIGNINWFMGFIALTLPIILIRFLRNTDKSWNLFYGIYLFMACIGIIFCRSDGLYIGLGICAFFAIPMILSRAQYLRKFMLMIAFYGVAMMMTLFVPAFIHMAECDGICSVFAHPIVAIVMTIVAVVGYIIIDKKVSEFNPRTSRIVTIVVELLMGAVVLSCLVISICTFDENWGTLRGQIWIYAVNVFREMPFLNKLIGYGPETAFYYNQALNEIRGGIVLVNHSDFMQFLVTNGILGLAAWVTMWASLFFEYIRTKDHNDLAMGFFVALAAYFGQSLVNTAECLSWPLLIVVMGLYLHYSRSTNEADDE